MKRLPLVAALCLAFAVGVSALPSAGQAAPLPSAPEGQLSAPPARSPIAAFSLVVPTSESASGLLARVVLPGGLGCPRLDVTIKGRKGAKEVQRPMSARSTGPTTLNAFAAIQVCEAAIPQGTLKASIAGRSIPATMPRNIDSIAILGDSGCRLKGSTIQVCNDSSQWPLARIARNIVADQPDLVIFLGDFFYREVACPVSANDECGGSPAPLSGAPFTDSAWGWVADSLIPMGPMLQSRPLVVVRGNHEACYRGGNGFFLIFDPARGTAANCAPTDGVAPTVFTPTKAIDLSIKGGRTLRLVNVDSANGDDMAIDDSIALLQRPLFVQADRLAGRADEAWLLTHRPIAAVQSTELLPDPPGEATVWSSVTQAYSSSGLLDHFDLMLSSHVHLAQAVGIPGLPGELVLGNAGTLLDPATGYAIPKYGPLSNASGQTLTPMPPLPPLPPIPTASSLQTWPEFGYAMASPTASGWRIDLRNLAGDSYASCASVNRKLSCS